MGGLSLRQCAALGVALELAFGVAACHRAAEPSKLDGGRLGTLRLYAPDEPPNRLVFLFADDPGPRSAAARVAQELVQDGVAIAVVDLTAYLKGLKASDDGCHYVVSELEDLSKRIQRELHVEGYHSPVLAGIGQGGTLAYAALAQSPAATIGGAVAVAPAPALATRVSLCEGAKAHRVKGKGGGFRYGPPTEPLHGLLRIAADSRTADLERWRAIAKADPSAQIVDPEGPDAGAQLLAALGNAIDDIASSQQEPAVPDLPLVEIPADEPGPLLAIIYSGDGGWRDLDKTIGEYLAAHGVPTVGVDSLRYFWHYKSPADVTHDLLRIMSAEQERFGTKQVVLIGYSFGAGILPFAWNRMSEKDRQPIVQLSLLGLEPKAAFEFEVSGWLQTPGESALPVLPEIAHLDLSRVQCFYGEDEEKEQDTLCSLPELKGAEVIRTTGGHHFDGDYDRLAQIILEGAKRRAAALGHPKPSRARAHR